MSITTDQIQTILGSNGNVVGASGEKIGSIGQVYVDDTSGDPAWVTVKTGLFGSSQSFVPLEGASVSGDDIQVSYDKDKIKDAPRVDDDGKLSPEEEQTLYSYYGVGNSGGYDSGDRTDANYAAGGTGRDTDYDAGRTTDRDAGLVAGGTTGRDADYDADRTTDRDVDRTTDRDVDYDADRTTDRDVDVDAGRTTDRDADYVGDRESVGRDTSGPTTDEAMTLSEERVNVGTQTQEAGRARLRKYVVTEQVTQTVPVSHEEVRLEREPITDANRGDATSGPDISEEEHEVVLHEERPVVQKETVPVERVRMDTETVTDNVEVTEEVRKERVDTDTDVEGDATRR